MTELKLYNPNEDQIAAFMTVKAETQEQKKALFNATTKPDFQVSEKINETINVKDVYIELVEMLDSKTGEMTKQPRTILFDDKGKSYACVSSGIYNSLVRAFRIFGSPTWDDPIKFKVIQIRKGTNNILSLQLA